MNIKKAVKIALAHRDKNISWLAGEMGMNGPALSRKMATNNPTAESIDQIAKALNMKPSEFVALGE